MAKTITGIDVELTEKQRDIIVAMAPGATRSEALSGIATHLLQDLSAGGAMLSPGAVRRIAGSVEDAFNEQQIIEMVEKGAKRFGRAEVVEYIIDPIYITPMEEWAKSNGRTMQSLVQDCMAIAFEQGWFYEIPPHKSIAFTEEQYVAIRQALGKSDDDPVFGADIATFIEQAATEPEPA